MTKFTATTDFRHDYGSFSDGEEYELPQKLAQYFVNVGWGTSDELEITGDATPPFEFCVDKNNNVSELRNREGKPLDALHSDLGMKDGRALNMKNVPRTPGALILAPESPRQMEVGEEVDLEIQDSFTGQETVI